MLFGGKDRRRQELPGGGRSLYPVLHVAETLRDPGQWARQREIIQTRVEIIRSGCAARCGEEEPV